MDRRLFLKGISLWGAALKFERARLLAKTLGRQAPEAIPPGRNLLPPSVPPEVVAWFWMEKPEFQPEGYRQFIDLIAEHTNFGMLATSPRTPGKISGSRAEAFGTLPPDARRRQVVADVVGP